MRRWMLFCLLAATPCGLFAAQRVTAGQLETILVSVQRRSDADAARALANLELTERWSSARLAAWKPKLPGQAAQQALVALADQSAFLDPPQTEIASAPAPELAEQRRILSLTVAYVKKAVPQLPNFFATRKTLHFAETPRSSEIGSVAFDPLHGVETSSVTVSYRDGREVAETAGGAAAARRGLNTWGEFGPILATVLLDAARNTLLWSRWERASGADLAVFAFKVPQERSHYEVEYCCIPGIGSTAEHDFRRQAGYRGEMAIDPQSGAILRLAIEADLNPGDPVSEARIVVEYGPVVIGGMSYICPVHSISLSRAQSERNAPDDPLRTVPIGSHERGSVPLAVSPASRLVLGPRQTLLNDVTFEDYHVFRSEVHIDTAANTGAEPAPPVPPSPQPPQGSPTAEPDSATVSSAVPAQQPPPPAAPAASQQPAMPPAPPAAEPPAAVVRVVARSVDVELTALDKKGHPVTGLTPADIEIYDNGRRQTIRFFSAPGAPAPVSPAPPAAEPLSRPVNPSPPAAPAPEPANAAILLIDAGNLAFNDLGFARSEVLRFLKTAPPAEPIGLYILQSRGFQVLLEPTADHARLAAELGRWTPDARDLARAQEEERRNRQQFDSVMHLTDMAMVNGNLSTGKEAVSAPDPELSAYGGHPISDALAALAAVARHLALSPGHKSLVWISSDNVLADWSDQAPSRERGIDYHKSLAVQAQELLNQAHISISALDASQLESGGIGADLAASNVQLNEVTPQYCPPQLSKDDCGELIAEAKQAQRGAAPGRIRAQMRQDTRSIQETFRELARATGGDVFPRSSDLAAEIGQVMAAGQDAYMLAFTPDVPADDTYHLLTVKVAGHRDLSLRYRSGYLYEK